MDKWEYYETKTSYYGGSLEDYLNKMGEKGWELIHIFYVNETIENKEAVTRGRYMFKHKIQQENGNKT